jgi:hypothetical protein
MRSVDTRTEVDDVDAHLHDAAGERVDELGPGRAHVPADEDALRAGEAREPTPSACATSALI